MATTYLDIELVPYSGTYLQHYSRLTYIQNTVHHMTGNEKLEEFLLLDPGLSYGVVGYSILRMVRDVICAWLQNYFRLAETKREVSLFITWFRLFIA